MIDSLRQELSVQLDPNARLRRHEPWRWRRSRLSSVGSEGGFGLEHEWKGATSALAHDDDDAALAVLVYRKATVAAVFLVIGRLHVTADIAAVYFDDARGFHGFDFSREGFADFVGR